MPFIPYQVTPTYLWKINSWNYTKLILIYDCMAMAVAVWLYGCIAVRLYGCMDIWLYSYMAIWLYGYMTIWLYGYNAKWLYGYMAIWPNGCMAVRVSCIDSNFTH